MDNNTFLLGALITVISALTGAIVTVVNAVAAARRSREAVATASDAREKVAEIHTAVNSNLTALKTQLEDANQRVEHLESVITNLTTPKDVPKEG
jgi:TolA-binding protein